MEIEKGKTYKYLKEKMTVSGDVKENLKKYNKIKKSILNSLKSGEKSIPQIVEETNFSLSEITYHLMSLRKFGFIVESELDDMDEYYFYKLK